ncbi:MAG: DNA-binding transcriptional regulator [Phycisphaerae bacterium]|nr:DNA-binding transcriptional regulator [Phycisphaerae bacterium]
MKRTPHVALLIETSREFGRSLLYGIARYAKVHGPWRFHRRAGALDSPLSQWSDWKVDGAIVRDVAKVESRILPETAVIFAQHSRESYAPFPAIVTNSESIGAMGARHFLDRGFEHFAYCGIDDYVWSQGRGVCFQAAIAGAGYTTAIYEPPASRQQRPWPKEQHLLAQWLTTLPKPVGLMCCNDDRALQVTEVCERAGVLVPEDVAILGVDNDVLVCDLSDPPISSIALNIENAGYEAARLLDSLMHGTPMDGQIVPVTATHIVTRQSTDVLAVADADLKAALRFIRGNAHRALQVNDVVKATTVSRRVLEKKFQSQLRRSVHREIRRVRIDLIRQLLVSTDLPVTEIARKAGFDGIAHVARYFREETGMSLRQYRSRNAPGR